MVGRPGCRDSTSAGSRASRSPLRRAALAYIADRGARVGQEAPDTCGHLHRIGLRHNKTHVLRELNGRASDHPPEFFEREAQLNPTRQEAWDWIWGQFGAVLRVDTQREGIMVRRHWRAVWRTQTRCTEILGRRRETW